MFSMIKLVIGLRIPSPKICTQVQDSNSSIQEGNSSFRCYPMGQRQKSCRHVLTRQIRGIRRNKPRIRHAATWVQPGKQVRRLFAYVLARGETDDSNLRVLSQASEEFFSRIPTCAKNRYVDQIHCDKSTIRPNTLHSHSLFIEKSLDSGNSATNFAFSSRRSVRRRFDRNKVVTRQVAEAEDKTPPV